MTKKHFIALADTIKALNKDTFLAFNRGQMEALADFCYYNNPSFNRERWFMYIAGECGPNGGRVKG